MGSGARFAFPREELRSRTVRGVAINAGFLVLIDVVVLAQGLVVTRLLGPEAIGLYGIVSITIVTLLGLKRVGIDEAFVAQEEEMQEEEFQRAFSIELAVSAVFSLLVCLAAPVLALAYGDWRLLGLTLALSYLPLAFALQAPGWVFFRRMDFVRQRSLQAIAPVVGFMVTVPLAAAGVGVWSLVIGPLAGHVAGAIAALTVSPYALRLRFERAAARRYLAFSGPIVAAALAALVIAQGQLLAFDIDGGLAAVGYITLALTLTRYVDRVDQFVVPTIYPVICALRDRADQLAEIFETSNRATLMWTLPFAGGLVLFAPDLVDHVLGGTWEPAVGLLQGLAVAAALSQLGFNWFSFYRAHSDTVPTAIEAWVGAVGFLVLALPGLALAGVRGFVAGRVVAVLITLVVRVRYIHRLLPTVRLWRIVTRSAVPLAAATAAVLIPRLATWGGRSLGEAVLELALFGVVYAAVALRLEGALVRELVRSTRPGRGEPVGGPAQQPG